LWSEGVSGAEIHQRLSAQYGNSVWPQHSAYEWIERLKNGHTSVTHEAAGHMTTTDGNIEHVHDMVMLDD